MHDAVFTQADFYWKENKLFQPSSRCSFHEISSDFSQTCVFNLNQFYIKDTFRTKYVSLFSVEKFSSKKNFLGRNSCC